MLRMLEETIDCGPRLSEEKPVVSVMVLTYRHAKYIDQCLASVLRQKTDFSFEVVISDDCSTDGTLEKVSAFVRQWPHVIRVVAAEKNVGMMRNLRRGIEACRGEFVALIEGDDFWLDDNKVQKQVDALRANPTLSMSFSSGKLLRPDGKMTHSWDYGSEARVVSLREMSESKFFQFIPTASSLFRSCSVFPLPQWFDQAPVGDMYLTIAGARHSGAWYVPEPTSCYRMQAEGSWTSTVYGAWVSGGRINDKEAMLRYVRSQVEAALLACKEYSIAYEVLAMRLASTNWTGFRLSMENRELRSAALFLSRIPLRYFLERTACRLLRGWWALARVIGWPRREPID